MRASHSRTLESSRGMTLVAVLVSVAIVGILAATLSALFGNMSGVMLKGTLESEERNMINYVRVLLAQPDICDYALRATTDLNQPPNVRWNFIASPTSTADIDHLEIRRRGLGAGSAALKTGAYGPNLVIQKIYIRKPKPELGEGAIPAPTTVQRNFTLPSTPTAPPTPQEFDVTAAKVVIRFQTTTDLSILGSPVRELTADVTVAVDRVDHMIDFCHQPQAVQAIGMTCDSLHLYPGNPDCPTTTAPCSPLYYISGFDSMGVAKCACEISCAGATVGF